MDFFKRGIETLRQPDRNPRCYDMSNEERLKKIEELSRLKEWKVQSIKEVQIGFAPKIDI